MKKVIVAVGWLIATLAVEASATTVNFEDMNAYPSDNAFGVEFNTDSFSSGGFYFTATTQVVASIANDGTAICAPSCPYNGTNYFLSAYNSSLTMTRFDGRAFSLIAFDGAGGHNMNSTSSSAIPDQIDVAGILNNGETVSQSFAIDKSELFFNAPLNFSRYFLNSSFNDLISVTFTSSGIGSGYEIYKGFSLDNLTVALVPEPESLVLMLAGIGLIGFAPKMKRKSF
jgi:hypothetical protein